MLRLLAAILLIAWLLALLAFHITAAVIHLLLLAAVISLVLHFVNSGRGGAAV